MMDAPTSRQEGSDDQSNVCDHEWNEMALPGFRFHPTEEELVGYYLKRMVQGKRNSVELIASLDLYQYDPWELPAMAFMGEKEWFFFCPRDKKYPNGARPNRVTASGYWKATGTDRPVRCSGDSRCIGLRKTLVFYTGRAPRGNKTEWIMNEYRMPKPVERSIPVITGHNFTNFTLSSDACIIKNDVALCRIYRKSSGLNSTTFTPPTFPRVSDDRTGRLVSSSESNQSSVTVANHQPPPQQQNYRSSLRLQDHPVPQHPMKARAFTCETTSLPPFRTHSLDQVNECGLLTPTRPSARLITPADSEYVGGMLKAQPFSSLCFDQNGTPSVLSWTAGPGAVSEEASKQLQMALRSAMAKLDDTGTGATVIMNGGGATENNNSTQFHTFNLTKANDDLVCSARRLIEEHHRGGLDVNNLNVSPPTHFHGNFRNTVSSTYSYNPSWLGDAGSSSSDGVVTASPFATQDNDESRVGGSLRVDIPEHFCRQHVASSTPKYTAVTTTATILATGTSRAAAADSGFAENIAASRNNLMLHAETLNTGDSNASMSSSSLDEEGRSGPDVNAYCNGVTPLEEIHHDLNSGSCLGLHTHMEGNSLPLKLMPPFPQYWRHTSSSPTPSEAGVSGVHCQGTSIPFDILSNFSRFQ